MIWQRLESTTIDGTLLEGEAACVADPLWLLGRQWQVGEFTGEDAGSPLVVEAAFGHAPLSRVRLGAPDGGGPVADRLGLPLEAAVEREPVRTGPAALRLAAEAGLELRRALVTGGAAAALLDRLVGAFTLRLGADDGLDPVGRAELALLARRAPDARAVLADLASGGAVVERLPGAGALRPVFDAWRTWYAGWCAEPAPGTRAWDPQHMEYRFQVAAGVGEGRELQLDATEYPGGHLDWYAFDVAAGEAPALGARGELAPHAARVLPTPARFAGQAASRWWQLEDAAVWFGDLGSAPGGPGAGRRCRLRHHLRRRLVPGPVPAADRQRRPRRAGEGSRLLRRAARDPLVRRARRPRPRLAVLRAHRRSLGRRREPGAAPLPMAAAGAGGRRA